MPLPEENTDESPYAPKDATTSYKSTLLSRLPSVAFGSEPFIQQTLFKRKTDCTFDLPQHTVWNKNMHTVSDDASCSKYTRRDTRPSDAMALRCCDAAAKHECVQWKTPKRDFTKDSSLSAISKAASLQTGFNFADIAYKPHKEAFAFQSQDEKLSSCTFHELLQSSWMSANLHCSMLHFNTTEHAISFMERQPPNLSISTSAVSALTMPAKSKKHSYIPGDINRQPRNELFQCCKTGVGCSQMQREPTPNKSPNKTGRKVDLVRDTRPDDAFDKLTEFYTLQQKDRSSQAHPPVIPAEDLKNRMQAKQRVSQRRAHKHERASADLTFRQHHSPDVKCKAVGATEAHNSTKVC